MNFLIAPDKFRGSLEADEVCRAIEEGVRLADPLAQVKCIPLADGGEGTARALTQSSGGSFVTVEVNDPLGRVISASYGLSSDHKTAFIEMAMASGVGLLAKEERDPLKTSTFGTGQLISDALRRGVNTVILGIGGSATNDVAIGMAAALGYRFLDKEGREVTPRGDGLAKIQDIDCTAVHPRVHEVQFIVACDVTNPLYGERGASFVFAQQKGASPAGVELLDDGMKQFTATATRIFGRDVSQEPGAGAAGGVGAGAMWFLNASLKEGAQIVIDYTQLEAFVREADMVITGEGKLDHQTLDGKLVLGLSELCKKYEVPIAALCGTLEISPAECRQAGLIYAASVLRRPQSLEQAQEDAFERVREATFHLVRLFYAGKESVKKESW